MVEHIQPGLAENRHRSSDNNREENKKRGRAMIPTLLEEKKRGPFPKESGNSPTRSVNKPAH